MEMFATLLMPITAIMVCMVALHYTVMEIIDLAKDYYDEIYIQGDPEHSVQHMGILTLGTIALTSAVSFSVYYGISCEGGVWVLYGLMSGCLWTIASHLKMERLSGSYPSKNTG